MLISRAHSNLAMTHPGVKCAQSVVVLTLSILLDLTFSIFLAACLTSSGPDFTVLFVIW